MNQSLLTPWIRSKTDCASCAELDQWQMAKVRDIVAYTRENSPFYQEHLKYIDTTSLKSHDNLADLPFTTSEQLRENPQAWLCCSATQVERIVTLKTSGTTSSPKRVFFTAEDLESTVDFFAHGMGELVSPSDKVMILMPASQTGSVGDLLSRGLARIGVSSVPAGPVSDIARNYALLKDSGCTCIVGIPVQVLALAQYGAHLPTEQRATLKSVLLSADTTPTALIKKIRTLFACEVFTHFGMTELAFGGAVECGAHQGCHIREADLLVEVVDPVSGRPLPPGQLGEFVITTLNRQAMPFIRYRTGDLGTILPEPCPCGSYIRRMLPYGGRVKDRCGDLSLWDLDNVLFSCPELVDYTVHIGPDSLTLTLDGIVPPDPSEARFLLLRSPLAPRLRSRSIQIQSRAITGFTGTGMQKRTLSTNL